jgi:four helix bundle protein
MGFMFEKLDVYQKGLAFVNAIISITEELPRNKYFLIEQLRRAALSIPLNIAEGNGRWHKKERRNFFAIARGSCSECVPILQLLQDNGLIDTNTQEMLKSDADNIAKMLTGLIKSQED